jgi:hypothetical protein
MAVRGKIKLDLKTVGITCFAEKLPGPFEVVRIALYLWIKTNPSRAQRTVHHGAVAVIDMFQHDMGIEGVVDGLAHKFAVEGLEVHIHAQISSPKLTRARYIHRRQ